MLGGYYVFYFFFIISPCKILSENVCKKQVIKNKRPKQNQIAIIKNNL